MAICKLNFERIVIISAVYSDMIVFWHEITSEASKKKKNSMYKIGIIFLITTDKVA